VRSKQEGVREENIEFLVGNLLTDYNSGYVKHYSYKGKIYINHYSKLSVIAKYNKTC
jgi:hypothetical protein